MKIKLSLLALALAACVSSAQIVVLERWSFDTDAAGTLLSAAENSGTLASSTWGDFAATTNGTGQFVIGDTTVDTNVYKNANIQYGDGLMTFEIVVDSWDLDDVEISGNTFRNFGITLRDSVGNTNLLDLQLNNRTTDRLRLRFTSFDGDQTNATAAGWDETSLLPAVNSASPLTLGLSLNTTTRVYTAYASIGASSTSWSSTFDADFSGLDALRIYAGNGAWANPTTGADNNITDFISIDSITFSAPVPEPSTYAVFTGFLVLGFVMIRRRVKNR